MLCSRVTGSTAKILKSSPQKLGHTPCSPAEHSGAMLPPSGRNPKGRLHLPSTGFERQRWHSMLARAYVHRWVLNHRSTGCYIPRAELAQEHRLPRRPGCERPEHARVVLTEHSGLKISNTRLLLKWHWNRFLGKFNIQIQTLGPFRQKPVLKLWAKITIATPSLISTESSYRAMQAPGSLVTYCREAEAEAPSLLLMKPEALWASKLCK